MSSEVETSYTEERLVIWRSVLLFEKNLKPNSRVWKLERVSSWKRKNSIFRTLLRSFWRILENYSQALSLAWTSIANEVQRTLKCVALAKLQTFLTDSVQRSSWANAPAKRMHLRDRAKERWSWNQIWLLNPAHSRPAQHRELWPWSETRKKAKVDPFTWRSGWARVW